MSITFSGILEVGGNDGQWCKLLLQPSTELYHRAVVSSATPKHKWIDQNAWEVVVEGPRAAIGLECQTEREGWSVSTGWVKKSLESGHTIWYQRLLQNKIS